MDEFPTTEAEIVALAMRLIHGLKANPEVFPNPPVSVADLEAALDSFLPSNKAAVEADAALAESTAAAVLARDELAEMLPPDVPGPVTVLSLAKQDNKLIVLTWEPPKVGAPATSYRVYRRAADESEWEQVALTRYTEIVLNGPDRGIPVEYRVVAFNQAQAGPPSSAVTSL